MDKIFNTNNSTNHYNNSNLTGSYANDIVNLKEAKTNEEIGNNILNNSEDIIKEKEQADLEKLLKPDSFEIISVEKEPIINGKFIQVEETKKNIEEVSNDNFDSLYSKIVPTENTIVKQYETPDLELDNKNN